MTLLNYAPDKRMIIGIGITNLFLVFYYVNQNKKYIANTFFNSLALISSVVFFLINLKLGFWLKQNYPNFIQNDMKIIILSFVAGALVYLAAKKRTKLFLFLFLTISIITVYRVNPIRIGVDPLINSPLANEFKLINREDENKRWVVYDNIILGNYLLANGLNTISGTYIYPQIDLMRNFDSKEEYKDIWNRYAHVTYSNNQNVTSVEFILHQEDSFTIKINPCNNIFEELDVKYYIFMTKEDHSCLKLIKELNL